jgi:uncharacterized membrane protein YdjX (TVP38/TMEM64 family)
VGVVTAAAICYSQLRGRLTLAYLARQEVALRQFQDHSPWLVYGIAFAVYVLVTGLSLPLATPLSLMMGWYFKFLRGTLLVSFASTTGATIAFLLSRYLFRDAVERRFAQRLQAFRQALDREGALYLFSLRLIPLVPFSVINVVMGLTRLRTWTFWWVSQVGMLPGTAVYLYAGSQVPELRTLSAEGLSAVFDPGQLTRITVALVLLGLFPVTARKILPWIRRRARQPSLPPDPSESNRDA